MTYWVFTGPDDALDPTVWRNGVEIQDAESYREAAEKRFSLADPAGVALGDFWIAGPDENDNLKLVRFKVEPTAFRIYEPERD